MSQRKHSSIYGHFQEVLLVSDVEVHARRDQASVQAFGPRNIHTYSKGDEAVDFLSCNTVDLVLCDSSLEDMTGIQFVQVLRNNMNLQNLPVIMITLENRREHVLDAIAAGCVGYVLRPYSMDTLERYLTIAKQLDRYPEIEELQLREAQDLVKMGDFDDAIEAFEEILSIQDEAQKYYDMGCQYLVDQKYGKAIISFKKAVKINDLFAEAYKGLADAYKGKGELDTCKQYLQKAAEVHAQFDRLEETKKIFIEILKYEKNTPNPFNTLGVSLRKQGDYEGALHAYQRALELTPEDENIYFNMAKAYYYMGDVDDAGVQVVEALKRHPDFTEARKLYQRVFGKGWEPQDGEARPRAPDEEGPRSARDI